jgi:hypothetical protein
MAVVDPKRVINGVECEIHADLSGRWTIYEKRDEGEARGRPLVSAESLDKAVAAARIELNKRKVRVDVPFFTTEGEAGIAHGKNSRDGRILTDIGQLDSHATVLKPDTPANKVERMKKIRAEKAALAIEERKLLKEYSMRLDYAVDRAVDAKQPGFTPESQKHRRRR